MQVPGMLHGKIFRSTVAHGRIKSIDTSAARKVPGVFAVYTSDDVRKVIPDPYYGPAFHDQPILAIGKVHFVGEPVAVVLAADPHVAEQAAQQIVAEYEELPAVFDEVEAAENKTLVHDELKPAGTFADLKHLKGRKGTNIALDFRLRRGDVDKGFAAADARVRAHVPHPEGAAPGAGAVRLDRGLPRRRRDDLHPPRRGRHSCAPRSRACSAGRKIACASRCRISAAATAASSTSRWKRWRVALSMLARRPVKIALTMEEQFYTITKHPSTFRIKSGVDKDGRIVARKCEIWWNGGAYADIGPRVTQKSGFTASGPYDIDNVSIDSYALYTNLHAGRRVARLRHPATGVGLREPHRHDRARAQARSARVPQAEPAARRPPAGDRHHPEGRRDREGARPHRRAARTGRRRSTAARA